MADDGRMLRALALGGAARLIAVDVTGLARETQRRHGLAPNAAAAAGVLSAATALMGSHIKGDERLAIQLQATSPPCGWYGEISASGVFRARFAPADIPPRPVVVGMLLAIKSDAIRELYRGVTEIQLQTIEQALQRHLTDSAQVEAVIRLAAHVRGDGTIDFAGGLLIERLPPDANAPSLDIAAFAERVAWLREAQNLDERVIEAVGGEFGREPIEVLSETPLTWQCTCSDDRVEGMLRGLGPDELRSIVAELGQAEVTCHFCCEVRVVPGWRLEELADGVAVA